MLEVGLVLSPGTLLLLFRVPLHPQMTFAAPLIAQETVQLEEIRQTRQIDQPPPRPRVVTVVADDVLRKP